MPTPAFVLISSSPPQTFARSPTPAESPLPFRSLGTPVRDGAKRFKSSGNNRDGFPGCPTSPRVLSRKFAAENIPVSSSIKTKKFNSQSSQEVNDANTPGDVFRKTLSQQHVRDSSHCGVTSRPQTTSENAGKESRKSLDDDLDVAKYLSVEECGLSTGQRTPCALEKAVPRRLDWTPVKLFDDSMDTPDSGNRASTFATGISSFTFNTPDTLSVAKSVTSNAQVRDASRRKRIDVVMNVEGSGGNLLSKSKVKKKEAKSAAKVKQPPKKPLTITGLSTSAYSEDQKKKVFPMVEYLTATQAAAGSDSELAVDASLKTHMKTATSRKAGAKTKNVAKSSLVSPTSAMKTTFEQSFIFGPASQLARNESPKTTRGALEAFLSSDPISPQHTQPFSVESTSPRLHGTIRFAKRRNLWGAAWRDGDNALLQHESDAVDLVDSPAVRQAFAGKDALMQLDAPRPDHTPQIKNSVALVDIDDITTPGLPAKSLNKPSLVRSMHISRNLDKSPQQDERPSRTDIVTNTVEHRPADHLVKSKSSVAPKAPAMPTYTGWSDQELKKQIAAFGFKAIRKREKMIELLERCWEDQHGGPTHEDDQQDPSTNVHGKLLGAVHDVSARPEPKARKPRAKRKSENDGSATPAQPKKRRKEPAKSTKTAKAEAPPKPKTSRSRAPKKSKPVDVDEIEPAAEVTPELLNSFALGSPSKPIPAIERPATPPPTVPELNFDSSSPAAEDDPTNQSISTSSAQARRSIATPAQTPCVEIGLQIYAAIHHRSENPDQRNHQKSPTWREKILMYDPIVLEELTAWLNSEGFRAIGEDREVSPLQVREWCEQNGVCCLGLGGGWRGGRGKQPGGE
jgi:hypothetical protein